MMPDIFRLRKLTDLLQRYTLDGDDLAIETFVAEKAAGLIAEFGVDVVMFLLDDIQAVFATRGEDEAKDLCTELKQGLQLGNEIAQINSILLGLVFHQPERGREYLKRWELAEGRIRTATKLKQEYRDGLV